MRVLVASALCLTASALVAPKAAAPKSAPVASTFSDATASDLVRSVAENVCQDFKKTFPELNANGWGVSTKAERWNGRHAMFGWVFIIATGYAQSHGLIPDADKALSLADWGTLAEIIPSKTTITNERAIIMIANLHALAVSILATFCPLSSQDTLLIGKGEVDEEPAGLIPAISPGLTPAAEMFNGRLAMLGLVVVAGYSLIYDIPMLTAVDQMLGGKLLA